MPNIGDWTNRVREFLIAGKQGRKLLMVLSVFIQSVSRVFEELEQEWVRQFPADSAQKPPPAPPQEMKK